MHVVRMGETRYEYRTSVGKPKGKRPLGRPRRRWEDIRTDHREIKGKVMDWMHLAQHRVQWRVLVNTLMNLRFQKKGGRTNNLTNCSMQLEVLASSDTSCGHCY
jgi:hypothetical protein